MDDFFDFDVYGEPDAVEGEHSKAIASGKAKAKESKPKSGCKRLFKKDRLSIVSKLREVDSHEQLLAVLQTLRKNTCLNFQREVNC